MASFKQNLAAFLVCIPLCVYICSAETGEENWGKFQTFVSEHERDYRDDIETMSRFGVFQRSLARQARLNQLEKSKGGTALYGVNKFSDLTEEEFRATRLCPVPRSLRKTWRASELPQRSSTMGQGLPATWDWRLSGVVTAVKDQGKCGSCWAFSVVETIESRAAILNHTLQSLSTQQVLSCDTSQHGCQGGIPQGAFNWLQSKGIPLTTEANYPFASSDGVNYGCKINPQHGVMVTSYHSMTGSESTMRDRLVGVGPLSIAVNANSWQDYIGGIIQHHCSNGTENHAVVAIGYDMKGEVPYWIVRNTWGTDWGVGGYVHIKFGENLCGLNEMVDYPVDVTVV